MSQAVHVRPLRTVDHGPWLRLWISYLEFYRESIDDAVTEHTFTRLCDATDGLIGLVATDATDQPIGLAHLVFHPSTWSSGTYCYLEDLYVDPTRRGDGTAGRLFESIYTLARERQATRVYWHTQQFNAPARSLYDAVGRLTSFVVYEHSIDE